MHMQSLKLNDSVVTDGTDKAEVLNSYFQSVLPMNWIQSYLIKGLVLTQVSQILMLLYKVLLMV